MNRRDELANITAKALKVTSPHAGLWLDKYLADQGNETKQELVKEVSGFTGEDKPEIATTPYKEFFNRWRATLSAAGVQDSQMRIASTQGRLSVGLGSKGVLETSITLHRTYGVPYIPGSALKGLAARYANKYLEDSQWRKGGKAHTIMFGNAESAGYLTFFDALYMPDSAFEKKSLWPDIITVHHPGYYQGNEAPADWDSPIPVPFLSATGKYLIVIGGDIRWTDKAFEILNLALREEGIGAKTSSGYGRMHLDMPTSEILPQDETSGDISTPSLSSAEQGIMQEFQLRLDQMPNPKVASEINAVYQQWKALEASDETRRRIAQAILDKVKAAGRVKNSEGKTWYQELQSFIQV